MSSCSSIARDSSAPSRGAAASPATSTRCSRRSGSSTRRRSRRRPPPRSTCTDAGLEGRAAHRSGAARRRGLGLRVLGPARGPARARAGRGAGCRRERDRAPVDRRGGRARGLSRAGGDRSHARRHPGLHARDDDGLSRRVAEDPRGCFRGRRGTIHPAGRGAEPGGDRDRKDQMSRRSATRWLVSAGLAALALWPAAVPAHAVLVKSVPAQRATLAEPPPRVELWFNERLEPAYSRASVTNEAGAQVDLRDVAVSADDPRRLAVSLPALTPGRYTVSFRVLSVDGHVVESKLMFTVKERR